MTKKNKRQEQKSLYKVNKKIWPYNLNNNYHNNNYKFKSIKKNKDRRKIMK